MQILIFHGEKHKLLIIVFKVDLDRIIKLSYEKKILQIKNIIKQWSKTIIGRITVVKSLLLQVWNHLFMVNPYEDILHIDYDMTFSISVLVSSRYSHISPRPVAQKVMFSVQICDKNIYDLIHTFI